MSRKTVVVNNRFTFTSTDNAVVSPEEAIVSNWVDTSNTAMAKLDAIVPEMDETVTDWKLATPKRLLNVANLGLTSGNVRYCAFVATKPMYVWLQDPMLPVALDPIGVYPEDTGLPSDLTLLITITTAASGDIISKGTTKEGTQPGQLIVGSTDAIQAALDLALTIDNTYTQAEVNAASLALYNARVAYNSAVVPTPYITVNRLFVLDGGIEEIWAINPAVFNSGANDSEVKMVVAYIL